MAIYSDVKIVINLSELVAIRGSFLGEEMSEDQIEEIAEYIDKHWDYSDHRKQIYNGFINYVSQVNVEIVPQLRTDRLLGDGDKNS